MVILSVEQGLQYLIKSMMDMPVECRLHSYPYVLHMGEITPAYPLLMFHLLENVQHILSQFKVSLLFSYHLTNESNLYHHTVPRPNVTIVRVPEYPVVMFSSNSLELTCLVELVPEVDTPVAIDLRWTGHSSLTDSGQRVVVSNVQGLYLAYQSTVSFSSLMSRDTGSYICSVRASPDNDMTGTIIASSWESQELTINISKYNSTLV